jgi:hypothetical protein
MYGLDWVYALSMNRDLTSFEINDYPSDIFLSKISGS